MIKAIKGTKDIFPPEIFTWQYVEEVIRELLRNFNYDEIRTPIFEETKLFARGLGETSDIVGKEMYTFTDKGGTSLTLKPEMTASVMRAVLEHSLHKKQLLNKFFYISPMFRQERPQAGRLRQFHQFGAEAIGSDSPLLDFEMILIPYLIFAELGLRNFKVKVNSLGSPDERREYKLVLRNYLEKRKNELSEESQKRFETNILRIFDSKNERDREIMSDAPKILDYISEEDKKHFETVIEFLEKTSLDYEIDHTLVRGLDYYTHTTFEIVSENLGAQNALCGGGRYNLLSSQLGGEKISAVGFAAGIERIILAMKNEGLESVEKDKLDFYVVSAGDNFRKTAYNFLTIFRMNGFTADADYHGRSVKAQMREANKLKARLVIIIGEEFEKRGEIVLKNMETGEQKTIDTYDIEDLIEEVTEIINKDILGDDFSDE